MRVFGVAGSPPANKTGTPYIPIPQPTLFAGSITSSSLTLTLTYTGPPTEKNVIFQQYDGVNWNQIASVGSGILTFQVTGLSPSTAYLFRAAVQTTEIPLRQGYWAYTSATTGATSGTGIKWNPGFGVQSVLTSSGNSDSTVQSDFSLISGDANFNHCHLIINWSYIETSQGVYNWSHVDTALAYAKSIGKRFVLEIWWQTFGVNPSNPTGGTQGPPAYIINNGWYYVSSDNTLLADFTNSNVQTAYANLVQAASNKYNADAKFEAFYTAETANSKDSNVGMIASLGKARTLGAFPNTNFFCQDNFGAFSPTEQNVVAGFTALNIGGGGPDTLNGPDTGGESWGQLTWRGAGNIPSGNNAGNWGTIDYRGTYPNSLNRQGQQGSQTWAEIFAYWTQQKVSHASIAAGNWPTAATQVAANTGALVNACPTNYGSFGGCVSGG